jgi:hypothetical protein
MQAGVKLWAALIGLLFLVALARCGGPPSSQAVGADPVRIRIPAIGVDAPVEPLTVDQDGVLPPPGTNDGAGWWRDGPEPGERGPAVIVGHLDSKRGPAVFFRLTDLTSGVHIFVDRADGTTQCSPHNGSSGMTRKPSPQTRCTPTPRTHSCA